MKEHIMLQNRWIGIVVCLLIGVLFAAEVANAKYIVLDTAFKDIGPISVLVYTNDKKNILDISEEELKSFVELKLRQSGIPVVNEEESKTEAKPLICINLHWYYNKEAEIFAFVLNIDLVSRVKLLHNDWTRVARTWGIDSTGLSNKSTLRTTLKEKIETVLTDFCNEYHNANPKK